MSTPSPPEQPKTKEEALSACVDQHSALVACFKTCNLTSAFTGCCVEEHRAFWECYTGERGTNQTRITSWLDDFFEGRSKRRGPGAGRGQAPPPAQGGGEREPGQQ